MACEGILEDVKKKAQIWKREYYEGIPDEQAEWKANVCFHSAACPSLCLPDDNMRDLITHIER